MVAHQLHRKQLLKCSIRGVVALGLTVVLCIGLDAEAQIGLDSDCPCIWQELPGGMDWGVTEISQDRNHRETDWGAVDPERPLMIKVSIRNRTSAPIEVPDAFYGDRANGGPACIEGVTMRLERAPFTPRNPDPYYPHPGDYAPVKSTRDAHFNTDSKHRMLAVKQSIAAFEFDLRDWFALAQLGYYEFHFEFDRAKLKLPNERVAGASQVSLGFTIGVPPPRITLAELNRTIDALGGKHKPAELERLIERELPATPQARPATRPTLPAKLAAIDLIQPAPGLLYNGPPNEPEIDGLERAGFDVVRTFKSYDAASVREQLERRLTEVHDPVAKLYVAAVATRFGSRAGALRLLESCKAVDEKTVANTQSTLRFVLEELDPQPPDWAVELTLAVLSDRRYVIEDSDQIPETIGQVADSRALLPITLGNLKCRNAVDRLIEMANAPAHSSNAIIALGNIGDVRAVPVLLQVSPRAGAERHNLEWHARTGRIRSRRGELGPVEIARGGAQPSSTPLSRRRRLRLGSDRRSGGNPGSERDPGTGSASLRVTRAIRAASVAFRSLSMSDPETWAGARAATVPGYLTLLRDQTLNEFARRSIVWRLGNRRDPRSIGGLVDAIHHDPSGAVVNQAITVLSVFKTKTAVEGLIDCFGADFAGKQDWKRAYTPEMFRANIAKSLQDITGEKFGPDRDQWLAWWQRTGRFRADMN